MDVFFREIFLRILEMRTASYQQKYSLLKTVYKICNDPQTLVDIYLNYDCDRQALDNVYERFVFYRYLKCLYVKLMIGVSKLGQRSFKDYHLT